jgi:hypothetical protein
MLAISLRLDQPHPPILWLGGLAISAAWILMIVPRAGHTSGAREIGVALAAMALTFVFAMRALLPPIAAERSARDLAQHYNREGRLPRQLRFLEERVGSFVFYLDPQLRQQLTPDRVGTIRHRDLRGVSARPHMVVAIPDRERERLGTWLDGIPVVRAGQHWLYRAEDLRW